MLLEEQTAAPRHAARQDRRGAEPAHRRAARPGAGRADGHAGRRAGRHRSSRTKCSTKITESMAQLYRVIPIHFEGNRLTVATCDPQNITIQDELRSLLGYEIKVVIAGETDVSKTLERYYDVGQRNASSASSTEIEDDPDLKKTMRGGRDGQAARTGRRRSPGRQRPGPQAAQHGAAAGDQGPRQRHPLRAVRGRVPHPHQGRRRAVRDGPAAAAPGLRHHHPHQGHGEPRHRRAPPAAGRPHRADRRRPPGRPARQRAAHDVRRERRHASARPLGRRRSTWTRSAWTRRRSRHFREVIDQPNGIVLVTGPTGSRQDDHALLGPQRAEQHRGQDHHDRGPGRIRHRRHRADARSITRSASRSPPACGPSCGRTRTSSSSAKSATWKRPQIAVQASLTGHLVFSTLHTNDAPSTITRLKDMGVPTFLITATRRSDPGPAARPPHLQPVPRGDRPRRKTCSSTWG